MAEAPRSLREEMISIIDAFLGAQEQPKSARFRIFSEQLPTIVEYYTNSKILYQEAITMKFAKKVHAIFKSATGYVPIEVENGVIERNVFHLKALQDRIPDMISESRDFIRHNSLFEEIYTLQRLCDTLCVKMLYIYNSDVHPFRTHHQMIQNAVPYMRTFLNTRFIFFVYSSMGGYSRMPHVYLNLTRYMEPLEAMFLKNCRNMVYTARTHLYCQICVKSIDVNVQDFALIGLCGHLYCLNCADWEPSSRHRMLCITCDTNTEIWIRNSFVFTTWKVSRYTQEVFRELDIPEDWYQVVPDAFYDIIYERDFENDGRPISLGSSGYLGSPGCSALVPIIQREDEGARIESDEARKERLASLMIFAKENPIFSHQWIINLDRPPVVVEAPPPPLPISSPEIDSTTPDF